MLNQEHSDDGKTVMLNQEHSADGKSVLLNQEHSAESNESKMGIVPSLVKLGIPRNVFVTLTKAVHI